MLIADLGDFSLIQSPAKCAARIGQAFSDTPTAVPLRTEVQTIRDVELNNKVFSDGVGTMSPGVMAQIWAKLPNKGLMPTCFQIRYKGMLRSILRATCIHSTIRAFEVTFESLSWACHFIVSHSVRNGNEDLKRERSSGGQ